MKYYRHRHSQLVPVEQLEAEYRKALAKLATFGRPLGDYVEFGVFHGASMACMHRASEGLGSGMRLFGFDSFDGLPMPTEKDGIGLPWEEGDFQAHLPDTIRSLTQAGVPMDRVILTKGWFIDTLNDAFIREHAISKASVIMVDCDLYSSAIVALRFCAPLIVDEAIVAFDDWGGGANLAEKDLGEKLAFDEFLAENRSLRAEEFSSYYHPGSDSYAKVFLVRRIPSGSDTT